MPSHAESPPAKPRVRLGLRVRGTVQGVGFRPSVFRLATRAGLGGFVRNDSEGVWIEVEGDPEAIARFPERLRRDAPPLSRVDAIEENRLAARGDVRFRVETSYRADRVAATVPADAATCAVCLRELFDRKDRRYRYPFVNCTDCGPRYTIVREVPYDRAETTMGAFRLCGPCRAEYEDPASRRFHAEPNACPDCGPRVEIVRAGSPPIRGDGALREAVADLAAGRILAVKGLGGFLLACDAANEDSVARLRERKRRPHKPFAVMARDLETARSIATPDEAEARALESPGAPIVLLRARGSARVAKSVAPGLAELGVMLPYTPLHHLLLADGPPILVMTSGNVSEEPIAKDDVTALEKLSGIADAFLLHDREIHTRADDSVVRVVSGFAQPVRRSRGFVPEPIALGFSAPPVLAVGGELKNTVCLTREGEAFLSPHVGDLENPETHAFFEELIEKLERLLGVSPEAIVHDFHPDYFSTRHALASGLPRVGVQHHHAHVASCLAEQGWTAPVIGVAFDGTGCGPAGELWGGEILLADLGGFRRLGPLRPIALAGGAMAIREPWRLAAAALMDAGEPLDRLHGVEPDRRDAVRRLLARGFAAPLATGAGRWFDAVSALLGIRSEISYEGQAAIELEAIASEGEGFPLEFELGRDTNGALEIDLRPTIRGIVAAAESGVPCGEIAAGFHAMLARAIHESCVATREETGVSAAALTGGCFQNRRLTVETRDRLESAGFDVLIHRRVPPNDGGLALGQAAVAAWRLSQEGMR
ncbi:MAG TPA: carbamoyltransferase HypF [Thermoanaerobaculia bacterium]|nr:carbamoyltransferase HypF [Thermoanaerobaculia bacterium]